MAAQMPPRVRVVAEASAVVVAAMRHDAAALAGLFYDAFGAGTPVDPGWCLSAAVLLEQFARLDPAAVRDV